VFKKVKITEDPSDRQFNISKVRLKFMFIITEVLLCLHLFAYTLEKEKNHIEMKGHVVSCLLPIEQTGLIHTK
jgi:hypothetical protein